MSLTQWGGAFETRYINIYISRRKETPSDENFPCIRRLRRFSQLASSLYGWKIQKLLVAKARFQYLVRLPSLSTYPGRIDSMFFGIDSPELPSELAALAVRLFCKRRRAIGPGNAMAIINNTFYVCICV